MARGLATLALLLAGVAAASAQFGFFGNFFRGPRPQVYTLTQSFSFFILKKSLICLRGKSMTTTPRTILLSFVPPSNSLVLVSKGLFELTQHLSRALNLPSYVVSGTSEIQGHPRKQMSQTLTFWPFLPPPPPGCVRTK